MCTGTFHARLHLLETYRVRVHTIFGSLSLVSVKTWSELTLVSSIVGKGDSTTSVWDLHGSPHDFGAAVCTMSDRKVFSSNLAHLSIVLAWLSGMHFHMAYFSNYELWLSSFLSVLPGAQLVWSLVGQDLLNGYLGSSTTGIYITSGLFQLVLGAGYTSYSQLSYIALILGLSSALILVSSYVHMHFFPLVPSSWKSSMSISMHHLLVLLGLGSFSWAGHLLHVSTPVQALLYTGVSPSLYPLLSHFSRKHWCHICSLTLAPCHLSLAVHWYQVGSSCLHL